MSAGRPQSPAGRRQWPGGRPQSPVGRPQSPVGYRRSRIGRQQSPVRRQESPPGRLQSPPGYEQWPGGRPQSPVGHRSTNPSGRQSRARTPAAMPDRLWDTRCPWDSGSDDDGSFITLPLRHRRLSLMGGPHLPGPPSRRALMDIYDSDPDQPAARSNKRAAGADVNKVQDAAVKAADKAKMLIQEALDKWQEACQAMTEFDTQENNDIALLNQAVEKATATAQEARKAANEDATQSSNGKPAHQLQHALNLADRNAHKAEQHAAKVAHSYNRQKEMMYRQLQKFRSEVNNPKWR